MTDIEAVYGKALADRMERDGMTHGPALGEVLLSEVGRLRGLIKHAEHGNSEYSCCPWCGAGDWRGTGPNLPHAPTCPAFTPEGVVR